MGSAGIKGWELGLQGRVFGARVTEGQSGI